MKKIRFKTNSFKRSIAILLSTFIAVPFCGTASFAVNNYEEENVQQTEFVGEYKKNQAIVCFKNDKDRQLTTGEEKRFEDDVTYKIKGVDDTDALIEVSEGIIALVESDTLSTEDLVKRLEARDEVVYAEPNYICETASADYTDYQYNANTEYSIGVDKWNTYDAATQAPTPEVSTEGYVVAVIDSGVDYNHEDLKNVMWDEGEKYPSLTALGGGKYGICTCRKNTAGVPYDSTNPMDDFEHGTHCAGIVAAEWNGIGVSGIASGAKIMAVKIQDDNGSNSIDETILGYEYVIEAKKAGVNIRAVNCSWHDEVFGHTMDILVTEAGELGIVSCFAAGNKYRDIDSEDILQNSFLANPYVVIVGATEKDGTKCNFSNYGRRTVDVFAPGRDIFSTYPTSKSSANPYKNYYQRGGSDFIADYSDPSTTVTGNRDNTPYGFHASDMDYGKCNMSIRNFSGVGNLLYLEPASGTKDDILIESDDLGDVSGAIGVGVEFYLENEEDLSLMCFDPNDPDAEPTCSEVKTFGPGLNKIGIIFPDSFDLKNGKLQICLTRGGGIPYAYIKTVFLCTEHIAYDYMSGTSMATPAVAGEAVTLAAAFPDEGADKIAARIKGSVKPLPGFEDYCESGGMTRLDLALRGETNPVINSVKLQGDSLKCDGFFFGVTSGSVNIDGTDYPVTTWSDNSVSVKLPSNFATGEHKVEIVSAAGRRGHRYDRIGTPKYLYDRLPLPGRSLDETTGEYTVTDTSFDDTFYGFELKNLIGLDGDLYALIESNEYKTSICKYDIDSKEWSQIYHDGHSPSEGACTWKGKIVYLAKDEIDNKAYTAVFDPETGDVNYTLIDDEFSWHYATLVNNGLGVYLIGGCMLKHNDKASESNFSIKKLDEQTMSFVDVESNLPDYFSGRNMASVYDEDHTIYVLGGTLNGISYDDYYKVSFEGDKANFEKIAEGKAIVENVPEHIGTKMVASPTKDGIIISGRPSIDDNDKSVTADTFISSFGVKDFKTTGKQVSMRPVYSIDATAYRGNYYALGVANYEGGNHVFATTKVDTIPQPGDVVRIKASSSEGGSLSREGVVRSYVGADESFGITPDAGYRVKRILVDGEDVTSKLLRGTNDNYDFSYLTQDHEIYVEFEKIDPDKPVDPSVDPTPSADPTPSVGPTPSGSGSTPAADKKAATPAVNTGDSTELPVLFTVMLISFVGIVILTVYKKRRYKS